MAPGEQDIATLQIGQGNIGGVYDHSQDAAAILASGRSTVSGDAMCPGQASQDEVG
jgi:hypothetical protein